MLEKSISIIIPVYNEEYNISILYEKLIIILDEITNLFFYEIIFIDDWSKDNSWLEIEKISRKNIFVKWISLSRNFWHQSALIAWYQNCNWNIIISMDCDMQDPPELIIQMINKYEKWANIVYARRINRKEWLFKKYTAIIYYKFHSKISDTEIPNNVWDFRLVTKNVLKSFLKLKEKDKYIRWIFPWLWYNYEFVDFERQNRKKWTSWYSWIKMIRLAMDWILSFSMFPLRIGMIIWLIIVILSILFFLYMIYDCFFYEISYPLYKWLSITGFWLLWLQFIFMWIIWEYIWRTYNQVRNRPEFIIESKININEK